MLPPMQVRIQPESARPVIDVRAIVGILGTGEYPFGGGGMQEWAGLASCNGLDVHSFFVDGRKPEATKAKRICLECPVRWACLEDGILEEYGIWGGLIRNERSRVLRILSSGGNPDDYIERVDRRALKEYDETFGWPLQQLRQEMARIDKAPEVITKKRHLRSIRGGR